MEISKELFDEIKDFIESISNGMEEEQEEDDPGSILSSLSDRAFFLLNKIKINRENKVEHVFNATSEDAVVDDKED